MSYFTPDNVVLFIACTRPMCCFESFRGCSYCLFLYLGSICLILNNILQAVTNDDSGITNRTIYFTVINPPKFGKLVKLQADKTTTDISSFTQQMVSVSNLFSPCQRHAYQSARQ